MSKSGVAHRDGAADSTACVRLALLPLAPAAGTKRPASPAFHPDPERKNREMHRTVRRKNVTEITFPQAVVSGRCRLGTRSRQRSADPARQGTGSMQLNTSAAHIAPMKLAACRALGVEAVVACARTVLRRFAGRVGSRPRIGRSWTAQLGLQPGQPKPDRLLAPRTPASGSVPPAPPEILPAAARRNQDRPEPCPR